MSSDGDDKLGSQRLTLAEVYAIALGRRSNTVEPEPKSNDKELREPSELVSTLTLSLLHKSLTERQPTATGWKKLLLRRDEPMTLADLSDVFAMAFTAAGKPKGAAMYSGVETESGWTVYFSPTAEKIFGSVMALKRAVDCDRPADYEVELLCGNPA